MNKLLWWRGKFEAQNEKELNAINNHTVIFDEIGIKI